jgi:hypothetical protein
LAGKNPGCRKKQLSDSASWIYLGQMSFLSVEYFNSFFGNYYMILSTPHSPPRYVFAAALLLVGGGGGRTSCRMLKTFSLCSQELTEATNFRTQS